VRGRFYYIFLMFLILLHLPKQIVHKGYMIVSGLAKSCDTVGYEMCLENSGRTIAVTANGLDVVYPKENTELVKRILKNGCLISEYLPNTKVMVSYFVERDRIQSGLSQVVVVIETSVKGGTIHTVKFGTEQRRKVTCINYNYDVVLSINPGNRC
jgi:DNA processing protein